MRDFIKLGLQVFNFPLHIYNFHYHHNRQEWRQHEEQHADRQRATPVCGWVEANEGRVGLEDESHEDAGDTDGSPVNIDKTLEKAAARVDKAESFEKVVEHPGVLGIVQDVDGDAEKREEALTQPRLDVRLDPPPLNTVKVFAEVLL